MWDYMEKQKDRKENLKHMAAGALGVDSKNIVVVNAFEQELKKLGLPQEEIERLVNK